MSVSVINNGNPGKIIRARRRVFVVVVALGPTGRAPQANLLLSKVRSENHNSQCICEATKIMIALRITCVAHCITRAHGSLIRFLDN